MITISIAFVLLLLSLGNDGSINSVFAANVDSDVVTKLKQDSNLNCSPANNCQNAFSIQTQGVPVHTINNLGSIYIDGVFNSVEIEQLQFKSNINCVNVGTNDCRNQVILQSQTVPTATVTNALSILNQVSNSAEVEQVATLTNDGWTGAPASCRNLITAQFRQLPIAAVINTESILNQVSNSAAVEQEATLTNTGCTRACTNTILLAQSQTAPITLITNAFSYLIKFLTAQK